MIQTRNTYFNTDTCPLIKPWSEKTSRQFPLASTFTATVRLHYLKVRFKEWSQENERQDTFERKFPEFILQHWKKVKWIMKVKCRSGEKKKIFCWNKIGSTIFFHSSKTSFFAKNNFLELLFQFRLIFLAYKFVLTLT